MSIWFITSERIARWRTVRSLWNLLDGDYLLMTNRFWLTYWFECKRLKTIRVPIMIPLRTINSLRNCLNKLILPSFFLRTSYWSICHRILDMFAFVKENNSDGAWMSAAAAAAGGWALQLPVGGLLLLSCQWARLWTWLDLSKLPKHLDVKGSTLSWKWQRASPPWCWAGGAGCSLVGVPRWPFRRVHTGHLRHRGWLCR